MTQPQVMSASTGGGDGSFTLARPSGLANGDLLVCLLTWTYNGTKPQLPSGFTPQADDTSQGSDTTSPNVLVGFRRVTAAGSEPATYGVTGNGSTNHAAVLARVQDVDSTDPLALPFVFTPTPNSTSQTVPGRNLAEDDVLWFGVWALQNYTAAADNTWAAPAGTTVAGQYSAPFNFAMLASEGRDAGAVPDRTATASNSQSAGKVASFALRGTTTTTPPAGGQATVREVVSGSGYTGGAGNSVRTLTTSAQTAVGDLLVAFVGADYVAAGAVVPTPTGTAGTWTPRTVVTNDSGASSPANRPTLGVFTRPVTVAGAQTVTADMATAAGDTAVHLAVYVIKDPDPDAPVLGASSVYSSSDAGGAVAPSVAGADGAVLLCGWQSSYGAAGQANNGYVPPAPMTDALVTPIADNSVLDSARQALTGSGATGTRTAARRSTATRSYRAASIAIAGAAAGPVVVSGAASLRGAGSLTVGARQTSQIAAPLAGAGTVTTSARQGQQTAAALAGAGRLTAGATPGRPAAAVLAGAGSLSAGARQDHRGAAELRGAGSVTAQAGQQASAALRGAGSLVAGARQTHGGAAALSGAGSLTVGARQEHQIRAALAGAGSLTVGATRVQPIAADLRGAGSLDATGTRVKVTGADLRGAGRLDVGYVLRTAVVSAALRGAGRLEATARVSAGGGLNISVWAVDRSAAGRLRPLPHPVKVDVSDIDSDAGAISIEYPAFGKNFELLRRDVAGDSDLEVEIWLEGKRPSRMVGYLDQAAGDDVSEAATWTFTGALLPVRLAQTVVEPQYADEKRELRAAAATPGGLGVLLHQQAQARGALTDITIDFTATHDSNGVPWPEVFTAKWSPGTSYLAVEQKQVELGLCEFEVTPNRVWRKFVFGTKGRDRTPPGPGRVTLRRGHNVVEAGRRRTSRDAGTDVLAGASEGLYTTAANLNARARRGRRVELYTSIGNLDDTDALLAAAQRTATQAASGADERTFALALGTGQPRPGYNVAVGDTVRVDTTGQIGTGRVAQWSLTLDVSGPSAQATTGDLIRSRAAALLKRITDTQSGDVVIGTSESTEDTGIPLAPAGLVVGSTAFTEDTGAVYASVTAGWAAVQSNVDGTAATDIDGYRVEWCLESAPDVWNPGADVTGTTGSFTVAPATPIRVRVQARDRSGNRSAWSQYVLHLTEDDDTPPAVASAPVGSDYLGTARWTWDGKTVDGADMLTAFPDFDFAELSMGVSGSYADSTVVAQLRAEGTWTVADLPYGVTQYAWLVAVDTRKNRSVPSARASATPGKIFDGDLGPDSVPRAAIQALAVGTAQIDNLAVNDAKVGNLSAGKITAGIMSADVTVSGIFRTATSGRRVEFGNAGLQLYDLAGNVTVNFKTADASALVTGQYQTALSGARLVMNPGGTSPGEVRFYPSSTNMYGRLKTLTSVAIGFENQAGINMKAYSARSDGQSGEVNAYPGLASLVWGNEADSGVITARIAVSQAENYIGGQRTRIVADPSAGSDFRGFLSVGADNGAGTGYNASTVLTFTDSADNGTGNARLRNFDRNSGIQFDTGVISIVQTNGAACRLQAATHEVSSSGRWKTAVGDLPFDPLAIVRAVKARQYERTDDPKPGTKRIGLIAEDLPAALTVDMTEGRGLGVDLYALISAVWDAARVLGDRLDAVEKAPTLRPFLAPR